MIALSRTAEVTRMLLHTSVTKPAAWRGSFEGKDFGSDVSIIFNALQHAGEGARLHRHPYSETFIVRDGIVSFIIGDERIEASAGQILVVPAGVPHGFTSKSDRVEMIDIHANPHFDTEWL